MTSNLETQALIHWQFFLLCPLYTF